MQSKINLLRFVVCILIYETEFYMYNCKYIMKTPVSKIEVARNFEFKSQENMTFRKDMFQQQNMHLYM